MKGEKNPFFGKKHTEELKQRQREHFTGKKNPWAGKKISDSESPRDKIIYHKWKEDRAQDEWFKSQGKRLVHIFENDFKSDPERCINKIIKENAN